MVRSLTLSFLALIGSVCLGDSWVFAQVGTEPWSVELASETAIAIFGHSLALLAALLLVWAASWSFAGPEGVESTRSRSLIVFVMWSGIVALDIATWPSVRVRGDLTKLRVLLDGALGVALVSYVYRPRWFASRRMLWLAAGILSIGAVGICAAFGTTALPVFPKIRRGPIAGILLMQVYAAWAVFTLHLGRPSKKVIRSATAVGAVAFVLAAPIAAGVSEHTTHVIVDTLEATRSLRVLHRRLLSLSGLKHLPGGHALVGSFPSFQPRKGQGLVLAGPTVPNYGPLVRCNPGTRPQASVLLLSIDSLRADYFGLPDSALPNLSRLRSESWSFPSTMQTCSGTAGSLYAMHTGRYVNEPPPLVDPWLDWAKVRGARYEMMMQGWDGTRATEEAADFSSRILNVAEKALEDHGSFLIHAHYMSVHVPGGLASLEHEYGSSLRDVDQALGQVFAGLRALGLFDQTVIVITGDHGEEDPRQRGYLGHGYGVWDSSVLTPLVIWTGSQESRTTTERVSGTDIFPTMLDLLDCHATYPVRGRSLIGKVEERPSYASGYGENPAILGIVFSDKHAVAWRGHKLMVDRWENAWALYDLRSDPGETRNLIDVRPGIVQQLRPLLDAYLAGKLNEEPTGRNL